MDTSLLRKDERLESERAMELAEDSERSTDNLQVLGVEPPQPPILLKFDPPIEYDGETYKSLTFDFESLIGKDFQRAERTFYRLYKSGKNEVVVPEMMHLFHCILAAQVADVPVGLIMKLPRRYYTPLRTKVLKACGSSSDQEVENE